MPAAGAQRGVLLQRFVQQVAEAAGVPWRCNHCIVHGGTRLILVPEADPDNDLLLIAARLEVVGEAPAREIVIRTHGGI